MNADLERVIARIDGLNPDWHYPALPAADLRLLAEAARPATGPASERRRTLTCPCPEGQPWHGGDCPYAASAKEQDDAVREIITLVASELCGFDTVALEECGQEIEGLISEIRERFMPPATPAAARTSKAEHRVVWRYSPTSGDQTLACADAEGADKWLRGMQEKPTDYLDARIESRTISEWRPVQEEVASG